MLLGRAFLIVALLLYSAFASPIGRGTVTSQLQARQSTSVITLNFYTGSSCDSQVTGTAPAGNLFGIVYGTDLAQPASSFFVVSTLGQCTVVTYSGKGNTGTPYTYGPDLVTSNTCVETVSPTGQAVFYQSFQTWCANN
ncbi:hypothetical protein BOTBODRAFT_180665 [Botryobasidium botryosum FD-172 SS1]|uniref:AA1-like domain-containing protein n=1 Tax=Botryobasidium botryosum (strain FD-172 SS1) TaxID=930990 RepID=A0A067M6I4_BOTB1|nr:hypothetical protein BOTBODRAFT_180665 [Botryobasidium botryosum FD-172 SS1]